ncbi:molecular chaperone TorD family protein [Paenibacillus sp. VCA1]|uniref:TorD/DmsD family molecular chaperone n=1 Tax=Paenibacillus sp. VCA1 TaxID=3039148 RepID=UPI0028724DB5|nr:molecular chaperone TorD family protein [Paenibacillus sp. VCA1]MDR9853446.1 molecular chaperone TorD family protein [Paenibacillus sp. VCA1]
MTTTLEPLLDTLEGARWHQGRGWAYQLLIDFLENPPGLAQIAPWQRQAELREELALTDGGRRLQDYLGRLSPGRLVEACRKETAEYERLFIGRDAVFPSVCESAYRTADPRSAWRCIRQIREAYEDCGIVFNKLQSENDDHLTIELEFIAVAGEHMAFTAGLPECRLMWLDTQIDFLDRHLLQWAPHFAKELTEQARTPLYREIGSMLGEFIPYDLRMLKSMRNELA